MDRFHEMSGADVIAHWAPWIRGSLLFFFSFGILCLLRLSRKWAFKFQKVQLNKTGFPFLQFLTFAVITTVVYMLTEETAKYVNAVPSHCQEMPLLFYSHYVWLWIIQPVAVYLYFNCEDKNLLSEKDFTARLRQRFITNITFAIVGSALVASFFHLLQGMILDSCGYLN